MLSTGVMIFCGLKSERQPQQGLSNPSRFSVDRRYLLIRTSQGKWWCRVLLLSIDVKPDLLLAIWNRDISLGRGNDNGFPCRGWTKLFCKVHTNRQYRSFDSHLNILHNPILSWRTIRWFPPAARRSPDAGVGCRSCVCSGRTGSVLQALCLRIPCASGRMSCRRAFSRCLATGFGRPHLGS